MPFTWRPLGIAFTILYSTVKLLSILFSEFKTCGSITFLICTRASLCLECCCFCVSARHSQGPEQLKTKSHMTLASQHLCVSLQCALPLDCPACSVWLASFWSNRGWVTVPVTTLYASHSVPGPVIGVDCCLLSPFSCWKTSKILWAAPHLRKIHYAGNWKVSVSPRTLLHFLLITFKADWLLFYDVSL